MEHFWMLWIVIAGVLFVIAYILSDPPDHD